MSSKDRPNLLAIADAIDRIGSYTKGLGSAEEFYRSNVIFDACLMNFIVAATQLYGDCFD